MTSHVQNYDTGYNGDGYNNDSNNDDDTMMIELLLRDFVCGRLCVC